MPQVHLMQGTFIGANSAMNEGRVSLSSDSASKGGPSERKRSCCSSYGGFHDCSMLNYTRLSATSGLNSSSSPSTTSDTTRLAILDKRALVAAPATQQLTGDRGGSRSSSQMATPPPYRSPIKSSPYEMRSVGLDLKEKTLHCAS